MFASMTQCILSMSLFPQAHCFVAHPGFSMHWIDKMRKHKRDNPINLCQASQPFWFNHSSYYLFVMCDWDIDFNYSAKRHDDLQLIMSLGARNTMGSMGTHNINKYEHQMNINEHIHLNIYIYICIRGWLAPNDASDGVDLPQ